MARDIPRTRHRVGRVKLVLLKPFFRWSAGRDAYVLRGIGAKRGPVLVSSERTRGIDTFRH